MKLSFARKKVLITGSTGIFGQRIAVAFAQEGASLFLVARDKTTDQATTLETRGAATVRYRSVDLADAEAIGAMVEEVAEVWRAPDIVINNAGLYPMDPLLSLTTDKWDMVMGVNLRAPFVLTRELAKLMIREKTKGAFINITSGAAERAKVGHGHYSTSKAGLQMLTKSFALELAPFHIRVNAVIPGFAPGSEESRLPTEYVAKFTASIPLGRVSGETDAPAAIMFLASDEASFITGATLAVDGGRGAGTLSEEERAGLTAGN